MSDHAPADSGGAPAARAARPFDPLVIGGFFDARDRERIVSEMRSAEGAAATVYGRAESAVVEERVRRAARVAPSPETAGLVGRRLLECRERVAAHFGLGLGRLEEPQFLRYRAGDFFVAHQDGNTGLLRLERDEERRVSVVVLLNRQSDAPAPGAYGGGSLVFSGRLVGPSPTELPPAREAGTLVAFRSETTHEVTPITHGERFSIACWYWRAAAA